MQTQFLNHYFEDSEQNPTQYIVGLTHSYEFLMQTNIF